MDNKILGTIVIVAVAIIIGVAFLTASAGYIGSATSTVSISNTTYVVTTGYNDLSGYQTIIGTYSIYNTSAGTAIPVSNISIVDRVGSDGQKTASVYVIDSKWNNNNISVVATLGPDGYIEDSSGRAVAGLIVIFTALAIAVVAMYPSIKEKFGLG